MIPEDYLALTLNNVLALHDPRRTYNGASVDQLEAALRGLEARLATHGQRMSSLAARAVRPAQGDP